MLTFKDYAEMNGVTYEAVRSQVKRYEKELDGHIRKVGRKQFLDDVAIAFLDEKRQDHPVILKEQGKDDLIASLEAQVKHLLAENARLANEAAAAQKDAREIEKENNALRLENKDVKFLQESVRSKDELIATQNAKIAEISLENKKKDESLTESEKQLKTASDEVSELQREVYFYENQSFFDRIRGKKYQKQG